MNRLVTAVVLALVAGLLPMAERHAAAAPTDGTSMIWLVGWPNFPAGQVAVTRDGPWTRLSVVGVTVSFREAGGGNLVVGEHLDAQPSTGTDIARNGLGGFEYPGACDTADRRFAVDQAEYEGDVLVRFAARVWAYCRVNGVLVQAMSGVVALHATVPVAAHQVEPVSVLTAPAGSHNRYALHITNTGNAPLHVDPARIVDDPTAAFSIDHDGCAAAPVPIATTCTITYIVDPVEDVRATVEIVSDFNRYGELPEPVLLVVHVSGTVEDHPLLPGNDVFPMPPTRLLDTRNAIGVPTTTPLGSVPVSVPIAGRGGVPADATGVIFNITVTTPTTPGFLTVYPTGVERPVVANLNFVASDTIGNLSTLALGDGGSLDVFSSAMAAHVIIDVVAYLRPEAYFDNETGLGLRMDDSARRLIDTRDTVPVGPGGTITVQAFDAAPALTAVLVNITAVEPTRDTYVTSWASGAPRPGTSALNVRAGEIRGNLSLVTVGADGRIALYNYAGTTHVVVDLVAVFADRGFGATRGRIVPLEPFRAVDTRVTGDPFTAYEVGGYRVPPRIGPWEIGGVLANVAVTQPTAPGFLVVFPWDVSFIPLISTANFVAGQTVSNHSFVRIAREPSNLIGFGNGSDGSVHVVVDIQAIVLR